MINKITISGILLSLGFLVGDIYRLKNVYGEQDNLKEKVLIAWVENKFIECKFGGKLLLIKSNKDNYITSSYVKYNDSILIDLENCKPKD